MAESRATLILDLGRESSAMVATDQGAWLLRDPVTGAARWVPPVFGDGPGVTAEPEYLAMLRASAQRMLASMVPAGTPSPAVDRAVVMISSAIGPGDPARAALVAAAEAAGFTAVELLFGAAAAVWAPGSPLRVGDVALVCDFGPVFEATLLVVGDDLPEVIGHAVLADQALTIDRTVTCTRDLLGRLVMDPARVSWVLPVGAGARTPGLALTFENGLGIRVAHVDEPELATVRGAAVWLPRSGSRSVPARVSPQRTVPLVFTIPGGAARLLRWLVEPAQPYDEGAAVARVRLPGGAIWDLVARTRGVLDEVLVAGGQDVRSGEWLALVRPT